MKTIISLLLFTVIYTVTYSQKLQLELFTRLPQVVTFDFKKNAATYTPVVAAGATVRYKNAFADLGSFVDKGDVFGHFTYFGSSVYSKQYPDKALFVLSWFGEVTYIPQQQEDEKFLIKSVGISPVLVWPTYSGTFALALTVGPAFTDKSTSLNSRVILNYSLALFKSKS